MSDRSVWPPLKTGIDLRRASSVWSLSYPLCIIGTCSTNALFSNYLLGQDTTLELFDFSLYCGMISLK